MNFAIPANLVWREGNGEWHLLNPINGTHIQEVKFYHCPVMEQLSDTVSLSKEKNNFILLSFQRFDSLEELMQETVKLRGDDGDIRFFKEEEKEEDRTGDTD